MNGLEAMRGTNSTLQSYDFSAYGTPIEAKVAFRTENSRLWDEAHLKENVHESIKSDETEEDARDAKDKAIKQGRNWEDFVKQCDAHFGEHLSVAFFSVTATIISGSTDLPDDLLLLKKSARKFADGKVSEQSGNTFGQGRFNNIGHYLYFVDLCISGFKALMKVPAFADYYNKVMEHAK